MECHDIQRIISERDDRPLRPDEQERLRIHVATCADCRAFERALRSGAASIASLPGIAPNPALRAAVLGKFGPSARAPRRSWLGEGAKLTAAVLAFALIGLVMATVLRPGGGDDDGPGTGGFGANPSASPTGWAAWPTSDSLPAPCVDEQVTYDVTTERATLNDDDYALLVKVTPLKSTGGVECWWSANVAEPWPKPNLHLVCPE
jgi:hypothetical protein